MIPAKPVNMADVAERAGVSIATVSRALRDEPGVSDATRSRIRHAAQELRYVISPEASRLAGGAATGRVAVVVPFMDAWFYATLVGGIESVLRPAGMDLMIVCLAGADERAAFLRTLPVRRKVDALVLAALPMTADERTRLSDSGIAVVSIGEPIDGCPTILVDDHEAAAQTVNHLIRLGHKRIAMLGALSQEGASYTSNSARRQGYVDSLTAADLEPDVVDRRWGVEGGAQGMEVLLSRRELPTAVFCHSDEVAVGAMRTLRRAGMSVPHNISITSVDDHPIAEALDLTTVHQPVHAQGVAAATLILDPPAEPSTVVLPTRLVVRGSTAPPRG